MRGVRAAAEVHQKLNILAKVREGLEQIDIFGAIGALGIPVLCRPLDGLLGAYISKPAQGILITTHRRLSIQRFTAAHELGHCWLKHDDSLDSEDSITKAGQGHSTIPLQEIEAESFASEFLLPKLLVFKVISRRGWSKKDLTDPSKVYQLSLRLGASYEATWRALFDHGFVAPETIEKLERSSPKSIKKNVLDQCAVLDPWADAIHVTSADNQAHILASEEDTVVIELNERTGGGYRWKLVGDASQVTVIKDESTELSNPHAGSIVSRKIYLRGYSTVSIKMEERRPWHQDGELIEKFDFTVDFRGKEVGIPRSMREKNI